MMISSPSRELLRLVEGHIKQHKLGLMGLEERAELLSGKITIKTRIGKGTTLIAQLPIMKG